MTRAALVVSLIAVLLLAARRPSAGAAPGKPAPMWLVIGATDPTPEGIARKARTLAGVASGGGLVLRLTDCSGERSALLVWATNLTPTEKAARTALMDVRDRIKKAVIKRCDPKPGSLLALGIPAVDGSMADAPRPSPGWPTSDRTTGIWPLAGGRAVAIMHYFVHQPEDPLEGRRERVLLILAKEKKKVLTDDCPSASGMAVNADRTQVTLQCSSEPAGFDRYHTTLAFDLDGSKVAHIPHCRSPRFVADAFVCYDETVDREGVMTLHPKRARLTR
jgi:hypothetical protein